MSTVKARESRDALATLRISRSEPPRRAGFGRKLFRGVAWLVVVVGAIAGILVATEKIGGRSITEFVVQATEVRVSPVQVETGRSAEALVVASGYLESRQQAKIGARGAGRIESIAVEEGLRVTKGQVLAILEHDDLKAAMLAAQAAVARTKAERDEMAVQIEQDRADFGRSQKLWDQKGISEQEYEDDKFKHQMSVARGKTLEAAVAVAEARVKEAQKMIDNMFVVAPFDGTVISKDAELGESILPGGMGEASGRGSVVTIADLEHLEVDTDVKEDYISRVHVGQSAEVAVEAVPDRRYQAKVRKIIPMGDRARATIKVKVAITDADERLFPEMSGTVYFLPDAKEKAAAAPDERKIFCSVDAIQESGDENFVWLVDSNKRVSRVKVETGEIRDGRIHVISGLLGSERVILEPPADLKPGQSVRVVQ